jgi:hypothetical protein
MKRTAWILALLLGAAAAGWGENLTLSIYQSSTNNLFQTAYPVKDGITSLGFSFSKGFKPFSFFTEGGYSHLRENPLISYYAQDAGLDYVHSLGSKTALYIAVKGGGTVYREEFRDLNHVSLGAVAAVKSYFSGSSVFNLNYAIDYRKYRWSLFDYLSHKVYLSLDKYLATRTTLRAEWTWGYKSFFHPSVASAETETEGTTTTSQYPDGRGYGGGWGQGSGDGSGGTAVAVGPSAGIQMASVSGLIAQGLGNRLGLQISALRQWTLSGENPFGSVDEFYMVENPTYDAFSWNGHGLGAQLTVNAPWNIELKFGYTGSVRNFPGIEAMDMDGLSLGVPRHDRRTQWDARLEKNFSRVTLFFSYSHIGNRSNDLLFAWDGDFLQAGFEWNLNWGDDQ